MRIGFQGRMLGIVFLACALCTASATIVASRRIKKNGEDALLEKSRAILSRLEAARSFVAEQGTLPTIVEHMKQKYPDGDLPKEAKLTVLKTVPIYAAMVIGDAEAEKDNYKFRIFSTNARNKDNEPTSVELKTLNQLNQDRTLKEVVRHSDDGKSIELVRPIFLSEKQGCMTCHGAPETSPWGNGKDVLGYQMEGWKDGDMHGAFSIISSLTEVNAASHAILVWGCLFTFLGLGLGYVSLRRPMAVLTKISDRLGDSSDQVSGASNQLATSSQALSSGASQAAASLEETAASMEEISAMVKQNAANANQAHSIAKGSAEVATKGAEEIGKLISAMTTIAEDAQKIEEITKVIHSIAFETNLLALNAAVEAARAGEHGRGFAVVAEAVRNLAQQSGEAAKQIETLIKENVEKSANGSSIARESGDVLNKIVVQVDKAASIISEIASAVNEQSIGIDQVTKSLAELDKATQSNAASSQESSASSHELSRQADLLSEMVQELRGVMTGAQGQ